MIKNGEYPSSNLKLFT